MKLTRRKVLIAGGIAGVAPAVVVGRAVARSPEDTIVQYIRSTTGNASIPDTDLYQFAEKYVARQRPALGRNFDAAILIMDNGWSRSLLPERRRGGFERFERRLITNFLFSTDYFTSAEQDLQRMTYVQYADAYSVGCRNPLVRFETEA